MPSQPILANEMEVDIQDHSSKHIDELKQEIHDDSLQKSFSSNGKIIS